MEGGRPSDAIAQLPARRHYRGQGHTSVYNPLLGIGLTLRLWAMDGNATVTTVWSSITMESDPVMAIKINHLARLDRPAVPIQQPSGHCGPGGRLMP